MSNQKPNQHTGPSWWPRRRTSPLSKAAANLFQRDADATLDNAIQTVYGVINGTIPTGPADPNVTGYLESLRQHKKIMVNSILAEGLLVALEENLEHEAQLQRLREKFGDTAVAKAITHLEGQALTKAPSQSDPSEGEQASVTVTPAATNTQMTKSPDEGEASTNQQAPEPNTNSEVTNNGSK